MSDDAGMDLRELAADAMRERDKLRDELGRVEANYRAHAGAAATFVRKLEGRISSLETVLRELRAHEERRPEHVKSVSTLFKIDAALVEKSDAGPASPSEGVAKCSHGLAPGLCSEHPCFHLAKETTNAPVPSAIRDTAGSEVGSDSEGSTLRKGSEGEAVDAWRASASPSARDPRMATEPAHTCVNTACGMPGVPIVPCPACAKLTPEQFSAMHYPQRTSEAKPREPDVVEGSRCASCGAPLSGAWFARWGEQFCSIPCEERWSREAIPVTPATTEATNYAISCPDGTDAGEPADRGFICSHENDAVLLRERVALLEEQILRAAHLSCDNPDKSDPYTGLNLVCSCCRKLHALLFAPGESPSDDGPATPSKGDPGDR